MLTIRITPKMKRHSKTKVLLASLCVLYVLVGFTLFQCYCLSEADFFSSSSFEAPDVLSILSCSLDDKSLFVFVGSIYSLFVLDHKIFLNGLRVTSVQMPSAYLLTSVFRC
jgi:hypothetical protein